MGNHVFISYAHADGTGFALWLRCELAKHGFDTWLDMRGISGGDDWARSIKIAIQSCKAMVFVMSPRSVESENCEDEWGYALKLEKRVIPLMVIEAETPFRLDRIQYFDFTSHFDHGIEDLVAELKGLRVVEGEAIIEIVEAEEIAEAELTPPEFILGDEEDFKSEYHLGQNSASLYDIPDDVSELPETRLVGRDPLIAKIMAGLKVENARILLQAFAGTGKTALAAQVAHDWLSENRGKILWLRLGESPYDVAIQALTNPFGASQIIASETTANKNKILRKLLQDNQVSLVVLDDVWSGKTLQKLQGGIPRDTPLLMTARRRYQQDNPTIIPISDLDENASIDLLRILAPEQIDEEDRARELCQHLGNLAFALVIAGKTMNAKSYQVGTYLQGLKDSHIDILWEGVPLGEKHKNVGTLIKTTLDLLDDDAKNTFKAWGAFWSLQITQHMMETYVDNTVDSTDPLSLLHLHGLATSFPSKDSESIAYYRLHELAFMYASIAITTEQRLKALDACLEYAKVYSEPSPENFAALLPEIDNLVGAAEFALERERYLDVITITDTLEPGVMKYRGYYEQAIGLLEKTTIEAAQKLGKEELVSKYKSNLGVNLKSTGKYNTALTNYEEAIAISKKLKDKLGEGYDLMNIGEVYFLQGKYKEAIERLEATLVIARDIGQPFMNANTLNILGSVYGKRGEEKDQEIAKENYQLALALAKEHGFEMLKAEIFGNLGKIVINIDSDYEVALKYLNGALPIFQESGDKQQIGNTFGNIGLAYKGLKQNAKAVTNLNEAEKIAREIGDIHNLAEWLDERGQIHVEQSEIEEARTKFTEARGIYIDLELPKEAKAIQERLDKLPNKQDGDTKANDDN